MRVSPSIRCPDEGEDVVLLTVDEGGTVGGYQRTSRAELTAARDILRRADADAWAQDGGQDDDDLHRRNLLRVLDDLLGAPHRE